MTKKKKKLNKREKKLKKVKKKFHLKSQLHKMYTNQTFIKQMKKKLK